MALHHAHRTSENQLSGNISSSAITSSMRILQDVVEATPIPYISKAVYLIKSVMEHLPNEDAHDAVSLLKRQMYTLLVRFFQYHRDSLQDGAISPDTRHIVTGTILLLEEISAFIDKTESTTVLHRLVNYKRNRAQIQRYTSAMTQIMQQIMIQSSIRIETKIQKLTEPRIDAASGQSHALLSIVENAYVGAIHNTSERGSIPQLTNAQNFFIGQITHWLENPEDVYIIRWVHGPAGFGKTTLARTICRIAEDSGCFGASIFWSRYTPNDHINRRQFVATIVYQLYQLKWPFLNEEFVHAINNNPGIFNETLAQQMETLVINPFLAYVADFRYKQADSNLQRLLLVFDGLDECPDLEMQGDVLRNLVAIAQHKELPLRILFFSRYQQEFDKALELVPIGYRLQEPMRSNLEDSNRDVEQFILLEFAKIKEKHSHIKFPSEWPPTGDVKVLTTRSNGMFICASTLMKYIGSNNRDPRQSLDEVVNSPEFGDENLAFGSLDALYSRLLRGIPPDNFKKVKTVLNWMIVNIVSEECKDDDHLCGNDMNTILQSTLGTTISAILQPLDAIVDITHDLDVNPPSLRFFHSSFVDFLKNRLRLKDLAPDFLYSPPEAHRSMVQHLTSFYIQGSTDSVDTRLERDIFATVMFHYKKISQYEDEHALDGLLDALYFKILGRIPKDRIQKARDILIHATSSGSTDKPISSLDAYFALETGQASVFLDYLSPVIQITEHLDSKKSISIKYPYFDHLLKDPGRLGIFTDSFCCSTPSPEWHTNMARECIELCKKRNEGGDEGHGDLLLALVNHCTMAIEPERLMKEALQKTNTASKMG